MPAYVLCLSYAADGVLIAFVLFFLYKFLEGGRWNGKEGLFPWAFGVLPEKKIILWYNPYCVSFLFSSCVSASAMISASTSSLSESLFPDIKRFTKSGTISNILVSPS